MLKTAYERGLKLAFDGAGLTPEQISAAQRLAGIGGGLAGAGLGGLTGQYLGGRAAEALDVDPELAKLVGGGLGALAGGGLGGYAGSQIPAWKYQERKEEEEEAPDESALGALPIADYVGMLPDYGYGDYGYGDYGYGY